MRGGEYETKSREVFEWQKNGARDEGTTDAKCREDSSGIYGEKKKKEELKLILKE